MSDPYTNWAESQAQRSRDQWLANSDVITPGEPVRTYLPEEMVNISKTPAFQSYLAAARSGDRTIDPAGALNLAQYFNTDIANITPEMATQYYQQDALDNARKNAMMDKLGVGIIGGGLALAGGLSALGAAATPAEEAAMLGGSLETASGAGALTSVGGISALDAIQASLMKSLSPEMLLTNAGKSILMQEIGSLIQTGKLSPIDGKRLLTSMVTNAAATAGGAGLSAATNGTIAPNVGTPITRAGLNALQGKSGIPSLASAAVQEGLNLTGWNKDYPSLTKVVAPLASTALSNAYRGRPQLTPEQVAQKLMWSGANTGLGWAQNKLLGS